jgi:hypothetical protein
MSEKSIAVSILPARLRYCRSFGGCFNRILLDRAVLGNTGVAVLSPQDHAPSLASLSRISAGKRTGFPLAPSPASVTNDSKIGV